MLEALLMDYKNFRSLPLNLGPGSQELIMGDGKDGWFGSVTGAQLGITPQNLMAIHNPGSGAQGYNSNWLKFVIDRKIIYVAQLTALFGVSWNSLNAAGLIAGRDIVIGDNIFTHRVIRGDIVDPTTVDAGLRFPGSTPNVDNSEWGRTIFKVTSTAAGGTGEYAQISKSQMQWSEDGGNGNRTIIKERPPGAINQYRTMGGFSGCGYVFESDSSTLGMIGHRPVLELKQ